MGKTVGIPFGAVVTLKNCTPTMLVTGMARPGAPVVQCEWKDHTGKVHMGILAVEMLDVKKLPNRKMPHERNRT